MAGIQTMATKLTLVKAGSESADTVLAHLTSIGEQSTEAEEIDVTTLDSPNGAKEYIQGAKDPGTVEISANNCFDGQVSIIEALFESGAIRTWKETYPTTPDGTVGTLTYTGYVSAFTYGEATTDGLASITFSIRLSGQPVYEEEAENAGNNL